MTREVAIANLKADIKYWEDTSVPTEHYYMAIKALEKTSPCDLCAYNSPSSTDGKPCSMCPACERVEE